MKNEVKSTIRTPLGKFEPPVKKSWIRPTLHKIEQVHQISSQHKVYGAAIVLPEKRH